MTDTPLITIELQRAHWLGEERHDPPEWIKVDMDTAFKLIETGVGKRVDPLKAGVAPGLEQPAAE